MFIRLYSHHPPRQVSGRVGPHNAETVSTSKSRMPNPDSRRTTWESRGCALNRDRESRLTAPYVGRYAHSELHHHHHTRLPRSLSFPRKRSPLDQILRHFPFFSFLTTMNNNNNNSNNNSNSNSNPTSTLPCPPIHKDAKFVVLSDCMYSTPIIPFHPANSRFLALSRSGYGTDTRISYRKGTVRWLCDARQSSVSERCKVY